MLDSAAAELYFCVVSKLKAQKHVAAFAVLQSMFPFSTDPPCVSLADNVYISIFTGK